MQNQVSSGNGKATSVKGAGATIVSKAGPPLTKKVEPTAGTTNRPPAEAPTISNPGAFYIGKEVLIYSPPGSFLSQAYNNSPNTKENTFGEFRAILLSASFNPLTGSPEWGIIRYRLAGARRSDHVDLIPLQGCSLSVLVDRQIEDDPAEPVKK
jgi:hypothetical protein